MKRRKTFQHPDQLELGLLYEAVGDAANGTASGGDDQPASAEAMAAPPPSAEPRQQDKPQKRRRKRSAETDCEPEFALLHETGWQASQPLSLLEPLLASDANAHASKNADESAAPAYEPHDPHQPARLSEQSESSESSESLAPSEPSEPEVQEPRLWSDASWTVRVTSHEAGSGWAAEIHANGESEPVLVCPWEVDREKNPKPLDGAAFATLVKAAVDMRRRQERQLRAMLHKSVTVQTRSTLITVTLDIVPDEDDSHALLAAIDETGTQLAEVRVAPGFKLNQRVASAWVDSGYRKVERY